MLFSVYLQGWWISSWVTCWCECGQGRQRFQQIQKYVALGFAVIQAVGQLTYIKPYVDDWSIFWFFESTMYLVAGAAILIYVSIWELKFGACALNMLNSLHPGNRLHPLARRARGFVFTKSDALADSVTMLKALENGIFLLKPLAYCDVDCRYHVWVEAWEWNITVDICKYCFLIANLSGSDSYSGSRHRTYCIGRVYRPTLLLCCLVPLQNFSARQRLI